MAKIRIFLQFIYVGHDDSIFSTQNMDKKNSIPCFFNSRKKRTQHIENNTNNQEDEKLKRKKQRRDKEKGKPQLKQKKANGNMEQHKKMYTLNIVSASIQTVRER